MIRTIRVLVTATAFISCAAGELPPSHQLVSVGTHRLQLFRHGTGTPTVVIDAGLADNMERLGPLQERIAKVTCVCTYNRAGYGHSEAGPLPRHSHREAEELKALLDSASVPGPYVVVGHSLGALNVQVFAANHPQDVVGIVLLDPPPLSFIRGAEYTNLLPMAERMTAEWQALADSGAKSLDPERRTHAAFFQMIASEHREMFGESAQQVSNISSFQQIPLLVMAAGRPNPIFGDIAEEYQRYWIEQSRALSQKSANGTFVLAEEATHYLYVDVPDLVVASILSIVDQARTAEGKRD